MRRKFAEEAELHTLQQLEASHNHTYAQAEFLSAARKAAQDGKDFFVAWSQLVELVKRPVI